MTKAPNRTVLGGPADGEAATAMYRRPSGGYPKQLRGLRLGTYPYIHAHAAQQRKAGRHSKAAFWNPREPAFVVPRTHSAQRANKGLSDRSASLPDLNLANGPVMSCPVLVEMASSAAAISCRGAFPHHAYASTPASPPRKVSPCVYIVPVLRRHILVNDSRPGAHSAGQLQTKKEISKTLPLPVEPSITPPVPSFIVSSPPTLFDISVWNGANMRVSISSTDYSQALITCSRVGLPYYNCTRHTRCLSISRRPSSTRQAFQGQNVLLIG
ncbi:hypothetical protein BKA56DRAFT_683508 [Ilyonectria sp. MPI-CAGE-AT-0026]|nr:hypothetical protein BKA56DRAFT_683508 [Ilyonectria sp. MPI-CAGE-AT-0026]